MYPSAAPPPAPPSTPSAPHRALFDRVPRSSIALTLVLGITLGMLVMNQRVLANTTAQVARETAKQIATQIDTYTISMADIVNVRGRPIRATEETSFGQSVSTSTVNAGGASGGTGWAEATWTQVTAQTIRVVNTHASQYLCAKAVARAASANTCDTTCTTLGAGALTCTGSGAADGTLLMPGSPPFVTTITGLECLCLEASAAGTTANAARITRVPQ